MNLIQILIERKQKIKNLEQEVDGLRKELEYLYFANIRNLKKWKRCNTLLSCRIRKVLYIPDTKLKGNKRLLQLKDRKELLIELIEETRKQSIEIKTENVSKIG